VRLTVLGLWRAIALQHTSPQSPLACCGLVQCTEGSGWFGMLRGLSGETLCLQREAGRRSECGRARRSARTVGRGPVPYGGALEGRGNRHYCCGTASNRCACLAVEIRRRCVTQVRSRKKAEKQLQKANETIGKLDGRCFREATARVDWTFCMRLGSACLP
jgi:hypothetical protein